MKLILRDPKKKVILTNIFIWPSLLVLDHHYIKQILVEHHNYTKLKLIADTYIIILLQVAFWTEDSYFQQGNDGKNKETS